MGRPANRGCDLPCDDAEWQAASTEAHPWHPRSLPGLPSLTPGIPWVPPRHTQSLPWHTHSLPWHTWGLPLWGPQLPGGTQG